jgi:hypothetical protein
VDERPVAGLDPVVVALCLQTKPREGFNMALFTEETAKYLEKTRSASSLLGGDVWGTIYEIGDKVPASGIYRCEGCGDEITSNKGDKFPPQNHHQHPGVFNKKVEWRLIVKTETQG